MIYGNMLTTQSCRNNEKSTADGFQINESKCKEIRISFAPSTREFQPITINGKMSNL